MFGFLGSPLMWYTKLITYLENGPGLSRSRRNNAVLVLSCCRPCRYRLCRLDWLACVAGASELLVLAMPLLALSLILPGKDVFTCPKCGHAGEVKVFKAAFDAVTYVQKDKGTPDD